MKVLNYTFTVACISLLCAGNALAQTGQITTPVERTSFAYDSYYAADEDEVASPSDAPVARATDCGAAAGCGAVAGCDAAPSNCGAAASSCGCKSDCDSDCGCNSGCGAPGVADCPCGTELDCGEPWRWQACENCRGITYGGWLSGGITANSHGNQRSTGNSQLGFNNDPNPQINQAWLYLNKDAVTGGCGWDWGFRVDAMAGSDGPDTQAFGQVFGWDNDWDWGGVGNQYGVAIPQAYVSLAYNDLSVKLGHFYTIMGYEVVQAPGNFFYSHSYTMVYGEPFTHTGFLFDYSVNDQWTLMAGWTNGWDQAFHNPADASTFLGGISWTSYDEDTSITYTVNVGDWGNGTVIPQGALNTGDIFMQSIVLSHAFGAGWTYVLQSDLGINSQLPAVPGPPQSEWYGINQYLLKEINCCWAAGLRIEWFRDDDGVRVNRAGRDGQPANAAAASYFAATLGLNWKPNNNLRIRPEIRYDTQDGNATAFRFDPVAGLYRKSDLFTFGIDGVWTF